jgi:hypothetical protein
MTDGSLSHTFTYDAVIELAGPAAFDRGVVYHAQGRVEPRRAPAGRIRAVVRGTLPYEVELWDDAGEPAWSCSCPVGDNGRFCKHAVAVCLASMSAASVDESPPSTRAAAGSDQPLDVKEWKGRIRGAFGTGRRFIDYAEAPSWAADVDEVLDALEHLIDRGHAAPAVTLIEYAHERAEKAMAHIDDSDGWLTSISARISELHLWACAQARPDPVVLARRLAALELGCELDTFHRAAATYADVLGVPGLAEYRRVVEPQWRALGAGGDQFDHGRFALTNAMIGCAIAADDPDELVAIKGELRSPYDHLEIASELARVGRVDEAITWARDGLTTFANRTHQTPALRELLADLLRERGEVEPVMDLFWSSFEATPTLETYRRLTREAELVGQASTWKERALDTLRAVVGAHAAAASGPEPPSILYRPPAGVLVEVLLHEGDVDGAWVVAQEHGCEHRLWLVLARAREKTHPLEVIPIYEAEAAKQIDTKKPGGYRKAVNALARIAKLAHQADAPERFDAVVAEVRSAHARKRRLMELFDQHGW